MNTPILITAFRRVEKLEKLLLSIKKNKPRKIYVSCDGPRKNYPNEKELVKKVKNSIDHFINWDCEIHKLYNKQNLGCREAMIKAIDWFFESEPEGIILEDDCIPNIEFLPYCTELLKKYRNNNKIWSITGTNLQKGFKRGDGSYYLSKYSNCWGWATWRNRWFNIDYFIKTWPKAKESNLLKKIFTDPAEIKYWHKIFDNYYFEKGPGSWDTEWAYTCFINQGYTIIPNQNLVKNIGFDQEATHTKYTIEKIPEIDTNLILPINHPTFLVPDNLADKFYFYNHYGINLKKRIKLIIKRPFYYPKKIFKLFVKFLLKIF